MDTSHPTLVSIYNEVPINKAYKIAAANELIWE